MWFGDWEDGPYNSWVKLLFFTLIFAVLLQVQNRSSRRVVLHRTYLAFHLGENRSDCSTVIAFHLNSRWRPPPSWILLWSLRKYPRWFYFTKCTLISSFMKIGWLVQKLQLFFKILILAGISAYRGVLGYFLGVDSQIFVLKGRIIQMALPCAEPLILRYQM